MTKSPALSFATAITRAPSLTVTGGLRAIDQGAPDPDLFRSHHAMYISALQATGAEVIQLPALENYPDSVFVEDTALCLPEGVIIMRPGAPSRLGEAVEMATILPEYFRQVRYLDAGHAEGGDILVTSREILVGRSGRTDKRGVAALRDIVTEWGYQLRELQTPPGVLHFKTDCGLLDEDTILSTHRLAASGCFSDYNVLLVAEGEEACANAVRFNDVILFPAGFPTTASMLRDHGYTLVEIPNTEAAKIDGGMSCLSLRFTKYPDPDRDRESYG
ncbi:arginine deiminase family protein [Sneathiella marina]|uniref:Arginine deiminase family protein n=1 Tax=Sneathiella marina TaxID=2950108 RepID=A0ABY4W9H2_9PROT|nr:arginine deiminase family protein [Sneathiella marina]USG61924.1 arginine deiminase family protein [Sneathiella marina]